MSQQHDLGGLVAVVVRAAAKVSGKFAVEADVVLVLPIIRCEPVIGDRIANVIAARDVATAAAIRVGHRGEDLEIERVGVPQPSGILEVPALDGDFHRIEAARPCGFILTSKASRLDTAFGDRILELGGGVGGEITIDKNGTEILPVSSDHNLPFHVRRDVDLVWHRAFTCGRVAGVDDDVGIHLALPRIDGKIHEVDAEVHPTITTGTDISPVAE